MNMLLGFTSYTITQPNSMHSMNHVMILQRFQTQKTTADNHTDLLFIQ